jgi:uncharacterized protein YjbJ (UPF0337 family)
MEWDQVKGQWTQIKSKARRRWGRLTDDDLEQAQGMRERLIGKLQERYGERREWAAREADTFVENL